MTRVLLIFALLFSLLPWQATDSSEFDDFGQQIKEKQEAMQKLDAQIEIYKKTIQDKQSDAVTLRNQLAILNSRIAQIELEIQVTQIQLEELELEIKSLDVLIQEKEAKITQEKTMLASLLQSINRQDQKDYLAIFLTSSSFSAYFDQINQLEKLGDELGRTLKQIKVQKEELREKQNVAYKKKENVGKLKKTLLDRRAHLEEQRLTKDYLFLQTKSSENKFKLLLAQLRQDYTQFDREVAALQLQIEKKLAAADQLGAGSAALSWPVSAEKGITAYFHDESYPFRYLFEHSGIDIRVNQGTPVAAAAPGYVAWVRANRYYGNNVMIVHSNGLATLYAHFSKFNIQEDVFVKRGDIIGWSGGLPGTPGAGFSTGPHLHFEVRENGVPVDPMNYLIR